MLPIIAAGASTVYGAMPATAKGKVMGWLSKASGGLIGNKQQMVNYATSSEAGAAVVAEGLVRHGASYDVVADLFQNTPNAAQIRASLKTLGRSLLETEDNSRPGLSASTADTSNDVLRAELVRVLIRAFGSVEAAQKVQMALSTLRTSDFDWYKALSPAMGRT